MPVGPDSRYYVHATTGAARAQQEYVRDIGRRDPGWWAVLLAIAFLVVLAAWFFAS